MCSMETLNKRKLEYIPLPFASERRRLGITQERLAGKIGYTRQQLNRAEKGKGASFQLLQAVCRELEVPLHDVIPTLHEAEKNFTAQV
jgi:transcriptional regulator with XRE-family HTH domain